MKPASFTKRFFHYYKPYKGLMVIDMIAAFIISLCDLVYPMITRTVINDVVPSRALRLLFVYAGVLFIIYLVKLGLNYVVNYYGHVLGVGMQGDMRGDVFAHMQKLPFAYFDENKSGALMSRIVNDLNDVSELAHHGPEYFFLSFMMMAGSFAVLCTVNVPLTLIVFAFLPIFIFIMVKMQARMERGFALAREKTSDINAELSNSISGIRVAKAFDNEQGENEKFSRAIDNYKEARYAAYKTMSVFYSWMYYFIDLMYLVVLVAGGFFYFNGKIDMGDFAAYFLYIGQFINPIRKLTQFVEMYEDGKTGFKRFCEVMDAQPEPESLLAVDAEELDGDIVFNDVSFTYGSDARVLNHVNLVMKNGKKTALVGPSGAGKTTLCHLIPRFYDISAGKITIGGRDLSMITRASLRRLVGIVQQEVFLFTGTIADNIAYARADATREQIEEAARRAKIDSFIESLPDGYDTWVGERGIRLSGGQKQRIAIARIFLKNPQVLILDEATSALDNVTEFELQRELDELCEGRTTIVVAHRLSTVQGSDEIVVITDEGIEDSGTHEQLMQHDGLYRTLYNSQFA
ncbi:MAG: ABC transporter ATP-binding protein [Oscillospiraceae bacterium]